MNIEEYIESGILELYIADLLSAEERSEVERMMAQHTEVREEVSFLRTALEQAAMAPPPPSHIRENLQRAISAPSQVSEEPRAEQKQNTTSDKSSGPGMVLPFLLLTALAGMTYLWFNKETALKRVAVLESEEQALISAKDSLAAALIDCNNRVTVLSSGDLKPVYLAATEGAPAMQVRVLHNATGVQCYLDETTVPPPPTGKQYQLWALVGDQPTDLGIIDFGENADPLSTLNCVAGATAYAITLEPLGGSVNPTLTALTAVGAI